MYQLAAAQIAANGCRVFFYSGSQHVDGTLEHTEAQKVGKAFGEIEKFEELLSRREPLADAAILQSDAASAAGSGNLVVANAIGRCKQPDAHRAAILGAMQLCDYAKIPWKVVPEQELTLEEALRYRVILLPGMTYISQELAGVLTAFVEQGGKLVAEGACGLYDKEGARLSDFSISSLLGCHYQETISQYQEAEYGGYLQKDQDEIFAFLPDTLPPVGPIQYGVRPEQDAQALGRLVHPCTPLTETSWVNWWCPPPAGKGRAWPGAVRKATGQGCALYLPFDFFPHADSLNLHRQLFLGILEALLPAPSFRLETPYPETLSMSFYKKDGDYILHQVSHLAEKTNGDAPEIPGGRLKVSKKLLPSLSAARIYPSPLSLSCLDKGDWWELELPALSIHQIFRLSE